MVDEAKHQLTRSGTLVHSTTTPIDSPAILVRTVAVEVTEGPDAGMRAEADSEVLTLGTATGNTLVLNDPTVSRFHLELVRGEQGIGVVDLGSTNGTEVAGVRLERGTVPPGTTLRLGRTSLKIADGSGTTAELFAGSRLSELLGGTAEMRRLMARISRISRVTVPVLIVGESGTGKELVARAIHEGGARAKKPFITVDCASLTPTLVASELFGHEKGSFTGAHRTHEGAFERAHGGTVFLDEIGEFPPELQPQLLGALERRRFRRVGGSEEISVDVRIVCATNRDLRAEVNAGSFRMDLYYRIAVVTLSLPTLRDRAADIPMLVEHFLREAGHTGDVSTVISDQAMAELATYRWPGNVRELRNWVEATLAMGEAQDLIDSVAPPGKDSLAERVLELPYKEAREAVLADFERRYVAHLTERSDGNVARAARLASMDRSYLIKLIAKHQIR